MAAHDLREDAAEVRRDRQVAPVVALLAREARPAAVDLASADVLAADDHHRVPVAVIGAAVAVFRHCAAELAHRHDHHVVHRVAQVAGERRNPAAEVVEPRRQLSDRRLPD